MTLLWRTRRKGSLIAFRNIDELGRKRRFLGGNREIRGRIYQFRGRIYSFRGRNRRFQGAFWRFRGGFWRFRAGNCRFRAEICLFPSRVRGINSRNQTKARACRFTTPLLLTIVGCFMTTRPRRNRTGEEWPRSNWVSKILRQTKKSIWRTRSKPR